MIQPNNSPATSPWGRDAGPAPAQLFVDARGSVMNDKFAEMILAQSKAFAAKAGREAYNGAVRDTPVIMAKRQRFG
jgi:hypothetical protein